MKNIMTSREIIEFHTGKDFVDGYSFINKSKLDKRWRAIPQKIKKYG